MPLMKQLENKTYILIGAGNMAKYLLANANDALTCMGIYSRRPEKAASCVISGIAASRVASASA